MFDYISGADDELGEDNEVGESTDNPVGFGEDNDDE